MATEHRKRFSVAIAVGTRGPPGRRRPLVREQTAGLDPVLSDQKMLLMSTSQGLVFSRQVTSA